MYPMNLPNEQYSTLLGRDEAKTGVFMPPLVNIGVGEDLTIRELAEMVRAAVGNQSKIVFDDNKADGTPQKLMDISCIHALGWLPCTPLQIGLGRAYEDFLRRELL